MDRTQAHTLCKGTVVVSCLFDEWLLRCVWVYGGEGSPLGDESHGRVRERVSGHVFLSTENRAI
jgi:hypothetical protein